MSVNSHIVERIADWSNSLEYRDIPDAVIKEAKRCIIDLVGVTLAATNHPLVIKTRAFSRQSYAPGPSSLLGVSDSLTAPGAALVNATAGHVLDFDDTSYTGILHGSTVAFPAALASSDQVKANGKKLLSAFIAGVEVTYAIALLCSVKHYFKGWWSTATFGAFGAAAAAAKAMGLTRQETVNALALAGTQACGLKAVFGSDAKPYIAGRTAAIGVESAQLASIGLEGPADIFENDRGFLNLMNDGVVDKSAINRLGCTWSLLDPGIFFKQYPVCSAAQAATELTSKLLKENKIEGKRVRKVICEVPRTVSISLVYDQPSSVQEAQFSMPFSVANILLRGKLDLTSLNTELLHSSAMVDAMSKVEMRLEDALHTDDAPESTRIRLLIDDGSQITGFLAQPTGMPGNRMDDETLYSKFHHCTLTYGLTHEYSAQILEELLDIENIRSASRVFKITACTK